MQKKVKKTVSKFMDELALWEKTSDIEDSIPYNEMSEKDRKELQSTVDILTKHHKDNVEKYRKKVVDLLTPIVADGTLSQRMYLGIALEGWEDIYVGDNNEELKQEQVNDKIREYFSICFNDFFGSIDIGNQDKNLEFFVQQLVYDVRPFIKKMKENL